MMIQLTVLLLIFCVPVFSENDEPVPVVMWHGMGDSCCNPLSLGSFKDYIEKTLPGIYVLSLQVGSNIVEDTENGFFKNSNDQIAYACDVINKDEKLKNGYNAIGFSQGGQFLRAIAQRCPNPPMKNLVSLGGQHQGVYGFPRCPGDNATICDYIRKILNYGAYNYFVQRFLVQAQYWHDPLNEVEYKAKSIFLADINNENTKNATYKENLMKLENFIMIMFSQDTMVDPKESEWFGYYTPGQGKDITKLQDSALYKEDWLGLQQMDQNGKLKFLTAVGNHLQIDLDWFTENVLNPFLK